MHSEILSDEQLADAIAKLNAHEQETNCEMAMLFDAKGQFVGQTDGDNSETRLPLDVLVKAKGGVLVHNHPDNAGSFSVEDLYCCAAHELREVWACNKDGSLFKAHGLPPNTRNQIICSLAKGAIQMPLKPAYDDGIFDENEICDIIGHAWNLLYLQKGMIDCYEWKFGPINKLVINRFRELCKPGKFLEEFGKRLEVFTSKWD